MTVLIPAQDLKHLIFYRGPIRALRDEAWSVFAPIPVPLRYLLKALEPLAAPKCGMRPSGFEATASQARIVFDLRADLPLLQVSHTAQREHELGLFPGAF